jgi:hypothetical protein
MARKGLASFLGAGFILAGAVAFAASNGYQVMNGPGDFYFGHVSLVEILNDGRDPVILREDAASPEPAVLNSPLGPGDTVRTNGRRVEIQLDNGTILRLDADSELKIETILAQTLSSGQKLTNFVLRQGRLYAMYKQFSAKETFQIITPTAAVKMTTDTVAMVERAGDGSTSVQVQRGKAYLLYGPDSANLKQQTVNRNERMTIAPDHRFALQSYVAGSDFELWNEGINAEFVALHDGKTPLPKPIRRLPRVIFEWQQRYGNIYGEWLWDDYVGYVWRPFYNDRYPSGDWTPYFYGQWNRVGNQLFWVPGEPWGWVPYHLGVWHWMKNKGWVWIPGSAFAPAWVDWGILGNSYFAWRPWSLYDWMWWDSQAWKYGFWGSYYGSPFFWWNATGGPYSGYFDPGLFVGGGEQPPLKPVLDKVSKNQLQRPAAPYGMPKELYKGYKSLMAGLKKGDPGAVESLRTLTKSGALVRSDRIHSPRVNEQAMKVGSFAAAAESLRHSPILKTIFRTPGAPTAAAGRFAARAFDRSRDAVASDLPKIGAGRVFPRSVLNRIPQPSMRIRDWNPDVRIAERLGVSIRYFSRSNEVACPELNLRSSAGPGGGRLGGRPGRSGGGSAGQAGTTSQGVSSGGSVSASGGSASGASSGTSSSSGGSGGGGHIK